MRERKHHAIATAITANRARAAVAGFSRYFQRIEPPEKNWRKSLHVSRARSNPEGLTLSQPCFTRQRQATTRDFCVEPPVGWNAMGSLDSVATRRRSKYGVTVPNSTSNPDNRDAIIESEDIGQ